MSRVLCIIARTDLRRWHRLLVESLREAGFTVGVRLVDAPPPFAIMDAVLGLEALRFGGSLATHIRPFETDPVEAPDLVIDLSGQSIAPAAPVLHLSFNGQRDLPGGFATMMAERALPELVLWRDGVPVSEGHPMKSDTPWLSRTSNELLAGAVGLILSGIKRHFTGRLEPLARDAASAARHGFFRHYLPHVAGAAVRQVKRKTKARPFYWQTGYRRRPVPFDPAHSALDGAPFTPLPDDGERFYADPFLFAHDGRVFLFVEEYPYALGKGIISFSEQADDGQFGSPHPVLEEPHHLSYPQVFAHDGQIFMLPESGGAGRLVLYRADVFPNRWVIDTVLIDGADINDATLIEQDGRFFLFATQRLGPGSASDTLAVYTAPALRGPWTPHRLNPIAVDRAGARPGGGIVQKDGRLWLKVQDGSRQYGGGLGLREILQLDENDVRLGPTLPVELAQDWTRNGIHTLNGLAGVEVVDRAG